MIKCRDVVCRRYMQEVTSQTLQLTVRTRCRRGCHVFESGYLDAVAHIQDKVPGQVVNV